MRLGIGSVLCLLTAVGCSDSASGPVGPGDAIPPVLTGTSPGPGANNVALQTLIRITFSEPINPATVGPGSFLIRKGFDTIPGTYAAADSVAVFTPATLLDALSAYSVTVGRGIRDPAGNPLARDSAWSFFTAAVPPPAPPK
jgi:hypothetical protein